MHKVKFASLVTMAVIAFMLLYNLDASLMDYDEGAIYLYPGMLVQSGLKPYIDFAYFQPPLILLMGGFSSVLQLRMLNLFALSVLSIFVYLIGRNFGVGYFSVVFLLTCPLIMQFSRIALGDIWLLAFFAAFLWSLMRSSKGSMSLINDIFGGILAACAIMVKIQIAPIVLCLYAYLFSKGENERVVSFAMCCFVVLAFVFVYPGMLGIFDTGSYDISRAASYILTSFAIFSIKGAFLIMFAIAGLMLTINVRKDRNYSLMLVVLFSAVTIFVYSWANYRHLMFTIPILSVFAGFSLKGIKSEIVVMAIVLCSILIPIGEWSKTASYDSETRGIVANIDTFVAADELIYTEQPMLAYLADRRMPDSAMMWNGMGRLKGVSADDVIKDIDEHSPKMVIIVVGTPVSKEVPRIISTFGQDGADKIIKYLDEHYWTQEYSKRDYQLIRIWKI